MSAGPVVLVTAFEAFGGQRLNASKLALEALDPDAVRGARVVTAVLPCVFGDSRAALERALDAHRPDVVIACGQADGRRDITVERVAINIDDARIADNAGARPIDRPVVAGAPAAYFATLPIKAVVAALSEAGLAASVSQTAGTFVCNHVFFALLHALEGRPAARAGFIHLPLAREQAPDAVGAQSARELARALEIAARVCLTTERDLELSGGAVS